ncbi:hypothetical protein FEM03_13510 [Phragmitibacter flavus]|uniref:Uncharacterized protein n=1 Tax=Phragmitibacter flavus TaxID=2576071 RepID=A0A5R8KD16_9BACT|nr:hypothetical protein [Phragmitibacter flavus]TLD70202.1 hypothetical protein FEM03_13510 [Phragmitibacter flavus]
MRRVIYILLGLALLVPAAFLVFVRYSFMVSEGYPTWEAARNYLVRDGEIVTRLPDGQKVLSARCDDSDDIRIDGTKVITKIGYSWSTISIRTEVDGKTETIYFNPQKLNSWNRMLFVPVNPSDPQSAYTKFENGVEKSHSDVTREIDSEPGSGGSGR